mgnify:CR=1 FL=1
MRKASNDLLFIFLSTPSGWRATCDGCGPDVSCLISIHALRVEGDHRRLLHIKSAEISIHALRVEGDVKGGNQNGVYTKSSIHALRVEGDSSNFSSGLVCKDFYPRPPGGGRPESTQHWFKKFLISIHALRVEGDPDLYIMQRGGWISIHALRVEGDAAI